MTSAAARRQDDAVVEGRPVLILYDADREGIISALADLLVVFVLADEARECAS